MKKYLILSMTTVLLLFLEGCASAPPVQDSVVAPKIEIINPVTIDFGLFWPGTLRIKQESKQDLGSNAQVVFDSEWTLGESAGNVYPKAFTDSSSGNQVMLDSLWDNGGNIPEGVYNVLVDIDGMPGSGTIRNLSLKKGMAYEFYISFDAAKIDISLETDGDVVLVYPAGIHDKYENLGRLDNIPRELALNIVSSYTERNPIYWLIPAGIPLDIMRLYSNGDVKWFTDYTAIPESFINEL